MTQIRTQLSNIRIQSPVKPGKYQAKLIETREVLSSDNDVDAIILVWKLDNGRTINDYRSLLADEGRTCPFTYFALFAAQQLYGTKDYDIDAVQLLKELKTKEITIWVTANEIRPAYPNIDYLPPKEDDVVEEVLPF